MAVGETSMHVVELLVALYKEGLSWFKELSPSDWRKRDLDEVLADCRLQWFANSEMARATLNQQARGQGGPPERCIILEPWDKAGDVLLFLQPIFGRRSDGSGDKMSFHLGVLTFLNSQRGFFGYRYEGPEGGDSHNFYHVQPIGGFARARVSCSIEWYPDKWPTQALSVKNDCQLLLAVMLSIQGMKKVKIQASQAQTGIRDHALSYIGGLSHT